jgi:hypothetical protein
MTATGRRRAIQEANMAKTVGDFIWERLHQWGVRCVFGYPGDGINGLLGGLQRLGTGGSHPRTSTPQAQRLRRSEKSLRNLSGNYLDTHRHHAGDERL